MGSRVPYTQNQKRPTKSASTETNRIRQKSTNASLDRPGFTRHLNADAAEEADNVSQNWWKIRSWVFLASQGSSQNQKGPTKSASTDSIPSWLRKAPICRIRRSRQSQRALVKKRVQNQRKRLHLNELGSQVHQQRHQQAALQKLLSRRV